MYLDAFGASALDYACPVGLLADLEISGDPWENDRKSPEISDWLDPRTFPIEQPDDVCYLSLSSRWDVTATLDRQDYEWARRLTWYPTYGSGKMITIAPGVRVIERPDHIYARSVVDGRTIYLHREVLERRDGPPRYRRAMGDHLNGRTLDCRRQNLRWATPRMNARNKPGTAVRKRLLKISGKSPG